jgi:hypothetical protein
MGLEGLLVGEGTVLAGHIDYNGHIVVSAPTLTSVFPISAGHKG